MNLPRGMSIVNHRQAGESFLEYRARRRFVNKYIKSVLLGRYATQSRAKFCYPDGEREFHPARKYIPGPHRSHKPHEVTVEGFVAGPAGAPQPHVFRVTHPGTLVKEVK